MNARPTLADLAQAYRGGNLKRPAADPIGMRGLPRDRAALDALLARLCDRLKSTRDAGLRGRQLVEELSLTDARALRLLVAYGRVHRGVDEIVGLHGDGYYWGPTAPVARDHAVRQADRMGRCWFFLRTLLARGGAAMAIAQAVFAFAQPGNSDDLGALIAARGIQPADVLSSMISLLSASPEGRKRLAEIGREHADVLVPRDVLVSIAEDLERVGRRFRAAASA